MNLEPKPVNPARQALPSGLIAALLLIGFHLLLAFLAAGVIWKDVLIWVLQVIAYVFLGWLAAQRQAEVQTRSYEPGRGISSAAVGAPLTLAVAMWFYRIGYALLSASPDLLMAVPCLIVFWMVLDIALATGIGRAIGRSVEKQHGATMYDSF